MGLVAEAMGVDDVGAAIFDLLAESGLPTSLQAIGFDAADLDAAVRITVETDNGLNPAPVTAEAVRAILDDAYAGRRPGA